MPARSDSNSRGGFWLISQALLLVGFVLLPPWPPLESLPELFVGNWRFVTVALLWIVAGALVFRAIRDLGASFTPYPRPNEHSTLTTTGAYHLVRHPLYTSILLGALGFALSRASLLHIIATALLYLFFAAKATREERWLEEAHPGYADYKRRVGKLIPRLR